MSAKRAPRQSQRHDTIFLRAIGSLALASNALAGVVAGERVQDEAWRDAAEHLLADSALLMKAANDAVHPGGAVVIVRRGARVPVSVAYLDRLTDQIHRLAQAGVAQGPSGTDAPAP